VAKRRFYNTNRHHPILPNPVFQVRRGSGVVEDVIEVF